MSSCFGFNLNIMFSALVLKALISNPMFRHISKALTSVSKTQKTATDGPVIVSPLVYADVNKNQPREYWDYEAYQHS